VYLLQMGLAGQVAEKPNASSALRPGGRFSGRVRASCHSA
jgi:hypothetical protein